MNTQIQKRPCDVQTVKGLIEGNMDALSDLLPSHISPKRLMRVVLTQLAKVPALQNCTQASLFGSILQASALGLEPDGVEGALIPYKNMATFQPMFQGLIKLAYLTGEMKLLYAELVHANDFIEMSKGLNPDLLHRPNYADPGEIIGVYAAYQLVNGGSDFEYMTKEDVEKVRNSSKAKNSGPWVNWWGEMAKKTVIKRIAKRLPKSRELASAVEFDNGIHQGRRQVDMSGAFAGTGIPIPEDNVPTIAEPQPAEPQPATGERSDEDLVAE